MSDLVARKFWVRLSFILVFLFLCLGSLALIGIKEIKKIKRKARAQSQFLYLAEHGFRRTLPRLGTVILPMQLQNIPLGESTGVVLDVKTVNIRNVMAPYNASIVPKGDGNYLIFFRYDIIDHNCPRDFYTHIGAAELDRDFNQTDQEYTRIDLNTDFAEDPRVNWVGNKLYLTYNALVSEASDRRIMHACELDIKTLKPITITKMDLQIQPVEKNWVPFAYHDKENGHQLFYEYYIYPHSLLKLNNPKAGIIEHLLFPEVATFPSPGWPKIWGSPRGGTPAIPLDDRYIGLFHSFFTDADDYSWYIMGAYTFEKEPPFRITGISNYPIFYDSIFSTPVQNTAPVTVRASYPAGILYEVRDGRDVLVVSCGENDCSIKIIVLDKQALINSLKPIKCRKEKK